ncbi:MAG: restriction endonuclease [Planctomycetota bacterium]
MRLILCFAIMAPLFFLHAEENTPKTAEWQLKAITFKDGVVKKALVSEHDGKIFIDDGSGPLDYYHASKIDKLSYDETSRMKYLLRSYVEKIEDLADDEEQVVLNEIETLREADARKRGKRYVPIRPVAQPQLRPVGQSQPIIVPVEKPPTPVRRVLPNKNPSESDSATSTPKKEESNTLLWLLYIAIILIGIIAIFFFVTYKLLHDRTERWKKAEAEKLRNEELSRQRELDRMRGIISEHIETLTQKRLSLEKRDEYGQYNFDKWFAEARNFTQRFLGIDPDTFPDHANLAMATIETSIDEYIARKENTVFKPSEIARIQQIICQHIKVLSLKKRQLVSTDEYGQVELGEWQNEQQHFIDKIIKVDPLASKDHIFEMIEDFIESHDASREEECQILMQPLPDGMTGIDYEHHCAEILRSLGWSTRVTKASGDQGVDIVAERSGRRAIVQCKLYSSPVGNSAVQEVFAAKEYEDGDLAVVVSNNTFTPSAQALANKNDVLLMHHSELDRLE